MDGRLPGPETETDLLRAIGMRKPGHGMPAVLYESPVAFRHDVVRVISKHWICAGHASELAQPGDYLLVQLGRESLIVVHGRDDQIRALANVCRHRGSRLCEADRGSVASFICPYHAWTYGLDGALRGASHMREDFDKGDYGLKSYPVEVLGGLVFISLSDEPRHFGPVAEAIRGFLQAYGWEQAKVAHRTTFRVAANWKLAVENYLECYHCGPAHPEFTRLHTTATPDWQTTEVNLALLKRRLDNDILIDNADRWASSAGADGEMVSVTRSAMKAPAVTGSQGGQAVAPLMGRFTGYDSGCTYVEVGPLSTFLAYPDYGVIYRFIPLAAEKTEMELIWLVRDDAIAGRDYDLDRLTWLWTVTSVADKKIVEMNHQGVRSAAYVPGPYSRMEEVALRFVDGYLDEFEHSLSSSERSAARLDERPHPPADCCLSGNNDHDGLAHRLIPAS